MSKPSVTGMVLVACVLAVSEVAQGYDFTIARNIDVSLKGDFTYTARLRTEHPDWELATLPLYRASGNTNFEKWDLVNNKAIARYEVQARKSRFLVFVRGEAFYDDVFDDDMVSWESRKHAEYNFDDPLEYYVEGRVPEIDLTFRIGRQVVQWGESIAPVFAVAVNTVSPFFGARVANAGYTFRDYQVPSHMIWMNFEPMPGLALEGVWNPEFEPRYAMPVVGTYQSFTDGLGFGQDGSIDDQRPKEFKDQQQGGIAVRKSFPSLKNFEIGFYYYHHLARSPAMTLESLINRYLVAKYEEIDMFGMSFSHTINMWEQGLQFNGELAYRPRDVLQKNVSPFIGRLFGAKTAGTPTPFGGYERGKTLNWVLDASTLFSDVLPFAPWTFMLSPIVEFYGGFNISYDNEKNFTYPLDTYYYFLTLPLTTSDMISNTQITFQFDATGNLHSAQRSLHRFSYSLKVKYGDHLEGLIGYDMPVGKVEENIGPNNLTDRDALTFTLTWYFI